MAFSSLMSLPSPPQGDPLMMLDEEISVVDGDEGNRREGKDSRA